MAAACCSIVCFFQTGRLFACKKKTVITKETTWQMLQDIKNQVKKISHWAALFQIIIKLGKLFTVTNLFKSCPFMGSWICIQTDLDFYRFLLNVTIIEIAVLLILSLGTFLLHILWFLYYTYDFESRWVTICSWHEVLRMGLYRIILS